MEYDIRTNEFGTKYYFEKGTDILHREGGPAVEFWFGTKFWYINGYCSRIDGPAIIYFLDGKYCFEWWVDGERLPPEKETILNKWWNNKNGL